MVSARTQTWSCVFQLHSWIPPISSSNLRDTSLVPEQGRFSVCEHLACLKVSWFRNNTFIIRIHRITTCRDPPAAVACLLEACSLLWHIRRSSVSQLGQLGATWMVKEWRWPNSCGHHYAALALITLFNGLTSPLECELLGGKHCDLLVVVFSEFNTVQGT